MKEEVLQPVPPRLAVSNELAGDRPRYRKRRRAQLRHETAAVAAEIRRMRRDHWANTKPLSTGPQLLS